MRQCAACGEMQEKHAVFWFGRNIVRSICCLCHNDHFHFTPEGTVVRGLRGTVRPHAEPTVDLDAAVARANEDTHERMREASARRWTPEARAEMSRVRKAYWAQKRGQV